MILTPGSRHENPFALKMRAVSKGLERKVGIPGRF
jgi:hypothetical protein